MTFPNFVSTARQLSGVRRVLVVALLILVSVVLGYFSVQQSSTAGTFALWWPAAGVNVVAALSVGKKYRFIVLAAIVLTTFPISISADRPLPVAIVGALGVALEVWIVTKFSLDATDQPRLTTTRDVLRFLTGAAVGATVMGVATATAIVMVSDSAFLITAGSVMASHASAIIVIAPIALVNRLKKPLGSPHIRALHASLLAASVFASFSPGVEAPLAFLPVPFLAWAAFSFSMSVAMAELIGVSALIVILTSVGGGPFTTTGLRLETAALIEFYVITLSVTTLLIASARNERHSLEERNAATARLLHEAFEQAQNGFAIIREDDRVYRVMEANSAAAALLPSSLSRSATGRTDVVDGSGLHALLIRMAAESIEEVTISGDDELPVSVTITNATHSTFGRILLVSIVDLRPIEAAQAALELQLEREQMVIEELTALNQQKDDFVSSVTHELRTPITTVIGFSEELETTPLDETQKTYVTIIQRNAERLLSVVEDVLTFSKRMPGRSSDGSTQSVDVAEAIGLVLDDLRHSIRDKRLTVTTEYPEQPLIVAADVNDLARVVINLVTNAAKFTPADGSLRIAATVVADEAVVTITDSGPGIAPSDLDKVFDRFYRSSRAAHDGVPGTGLGLAIVRDLVTDMNGTIALESDGSSGTTARLSLPLARATAER